MQDEPHKERLLADVARFLTTDVLPALDDRALAFRVRIAAHLVGTVAREVASEEAIDRAELDGLVALGVAEDAQGAAAVRHAIAAGRETLGRMLRDDGVPPGADAWIEGSLAARLKVSAPRFSLALETGEDEWTS
jgi:hypothetical protein